MLDKPEAYWTSSWGICDESGKLANKTMHLTRPLQIPEAQRVPEPAVLCGQVMASVRRIAGEVGLRRADSCGILMDKNLPVRRYALRRSC